jgi:predicted RecB family nuclease
MPLLTERVFGSSFDCQTKCYLLLNRRRGQKTEYEMHTDESDRTYQHEGIAKLQDIASGKDTVRLRRLTSSAISGSHRLIICDRVEANEWRSDAVVLFRTESRGNSFQPVFFNRYDEVPTRAKLLLAFRALLVGNAIGAVPDRGYIIYGTHFTRISIFLPPLITKVQSVLEEITTFRSQMSPPLFLCSHCEICEFRTHCASRAADENNISRLEGISRTQIEEQHRKGIFTLHQYSHTFRSRKPPKRVKKLSRSRYFALQARAIRDKKVYIHGKVELPIAVTSAYLDIEGIPGRQLHYLFGLLVVADGAEVYRSFWVDDHIDEISVFLQFCEFAASLSATIFHYGNYEIKVIKELKQRAADKYHSLIDTVLGACHNVLSVVHHHCYFPTYSNRLKDVACFLGYEFDNPVNSGLMSIVFRERWEDTADGSLKEALIRYNRQDCEALKTICSFVIRSAALSMERGPVPGGTQEVASSDSLRKVGDGNRPIFRNAEFVYPEFEIVNKCAWFDYQRDRVFARTRRLSRRLSRPRVPITRRQRSLATTISQYAKECAACASRRIIREISTLLKCTNL